VMPYSVVIGYQRFGGPYRLHIQGGGVTTQRPWLEILWSYFSVHSKTCLANLSLDGIDANLLYMKRKNFLKLFVMQKTHAW